MVWGGFGMHHRTTLHRIRRNLTGTGFRDIIHPGALPALQAMGKGSILQCHNNCPRRAHVVNDVLQQQQGTHMDWPAGSLDLNPIENLWDILGEKCEPTILLQLTLTTVGSRSCGRSGRWCPRTLSGGWSGLLGNVIWMASTSTVGHICYLHSVPLMKTFLKLENNCVSNYAEIAPTQIASCPWNCYWLIDKWTHESVVVTDCLCFC